MILLNSGILIRYAIVNNQTDVLNRNKDPHCQN